MPEPRAILLTGAASGIGAATARRFVKEGWLVAVNYLDASQKDAAAAIVKGTKGITLEGDVTRDEHCKMLVEKTVAAFGRLDALVNAAGISVMVPHTKLSDISAEDFQRIYAVNTIGPFQVIRAAAPHLRKTGNGAVVNIASRAGITGAGSSIPYAASKGALNTMTLSLARALAPKIRVNAVCPGFIAPPGFGTGLGAAAAERIRANAAAGTPLKVASSPDDIAASAVFLASKASRHVTGETLLVDAGSHLGRASMAMR